MSPSTSMTIVSHSFGPFLCAGSTEKAELGSLPQTSHGILEVTELLEDVKQLVETPLSFILQDFPSQVQFSSGCSLTQIFHGADTVVLGTEPARVANGASSSRTCSR